jgi:hypothetical protein
MDNFNLKKFLVENKLTYNSRILNEEQQAADQVKELSQATMQSAADKAKAQGNRPKQAAKFQAGADAKQKVNAEWEAEQKKNEDIFHDFSIKMRDEIQDLYDNTYKSKEPYFVGKGEYDDEEEFGIDSVEVKHFYYDDSVTGHTPTIEGFYNNPEVKLEIVDKQGSTYADLYYEDHQWEGSGLKAVDFEMAKYLTQVAKLITNGKTKVAPMNLGKVATLK